MYHVTVHDNNRHFDGRIRGPIGATKQRSIFAEVFPFIALTVGVPLAVWFYDRQSKKQRTRRA